MQHIWKNVTAKECRIGLYHFDSEKDGKPIKATDKELKDALTKAKLRWKNILNEGNERILVMGANRPDSQEQQYELDQIVTMKAGCASSVVNTSQESSEGNDTSKMLFIPGLYLNSLLNFPIKGLNDEDEGMAEHHKKLLDILSQMKDNNKE